MIKAVKLDKTICDLNLDEEFNFRSNVVIPSPSDYIAGIDCRSGKSRRYSKFYIQYKKSMKKINSNAMQKLYDSSQKTTIWTVYPQR
jgi:hypothetical protein